MTGFLQIPLDHLARAFLDQRTSRAEAADAWAPTGMVSGVQYIHTMIAAKPAVAPNAEAILVNSKYSTSAVAGGEQQRVHQAADQRVAPTRCRSAATCRSG